MQKTLIFKLLIVFVFCWMEGWVYGSTKSTSPVLEKVIRQNVDSMSLLADQRINNEGYLDVPLYKAYFIKGYLAFLKFDVESVEELYGICS